MSGTNDKKENNNNTQSESIEQLETSGFHENIKMSFHEKVVELQKYSAIKKEKKAGINFASRSAEKIIENIKPNLTRLNLILGFDNDILTVGDELFVKSTAIISDHDKNEFTAVGFAMIPRYNDGKNRLHGQQDPQVTGSCISYANKYALQNLLCIDENIDIDQDPAISGNQKENNQYTQSYKPQNGTNKQNSENSYAMQSYAKSINNANKLRLKLQNNENLTDEQNDWFIRTCDMNIPDFHSENQIDFVDELIKFYQNKIQENKNGGK